MYEQKIKRATPEISKTLGKLADTIFRPGYEPGLVNDFPLFYSSENSKNLYFIEDEKGNPISSAGIYKSVCSLNGLPIHVASLGNVWTLPEHRGEKLASRIIGEIVKDLECEPVSLLLVSGERSIYTRHGCTPAGKMDVAIFECGSAAADETEGLQTILVKPEERGFHAKELLEIHENEPFRYSRNILQMETFLRTLGSVRRFSDRQLFEINRRGKLVGYVVAALDNLVTNPRFMRIIEWAGSRKAVVFSLPKISEYHDAEFVELHVLPSDFEMMNQLETLKVSCREESLQGTIRPLNVVYLFSELQPWFEKNLNGKVRVSRVKDSWIAEGSFGKKIISSYEEMSHWLFDSCDDCLAIPLMLTDDLNYV